MRYDELVRSLRENRVALVVAGLIAVLVGLSSLVAVDLGSLSVERKGQEYGFASDTILVDATRSPIVDLRRDPGVLTERVNLYVVLLRSQAARAAITKAAGLPSDAPLSVIASGDSSAAA